MHATVLDDRGVVEISGPEAGELLQRLVTNDVLRLKPAEARYAALLSPQGKIIVDFLVVASGQESDGGYLIDCPAVLAPDLIRRLTMYRLRAKVTIIDRTSDIGIAAGWPERPTIDGLVYRDPRADTLGFRVAAPRSVLHQWVGPSQPERYRAARILAGVPEGAVDFVYGETFPHEANLDRLKGVDFTKGCYVGQEVVSRVEHRGTARKRVMAVSFEGNPPPAGMEVVAGEIVIGTMGSGIPGHGLAMIRTDRASDASALGAAITCSGLRVMLAAL